MSERIPCPLCGNDGLSEAPSLATIEDSARNHVTIPRAQYEAYAELEDLLNRQKARTEEEAELRGNALNDLDEAKARISELEAAAKAPLLDEVTEVIKDLKEQRTFSEPSELAVANAASLLERMARENEFLHKENQRWERQIGAWKEMTVVKQEARIAELEPLREYNGQLAAKLGAAEQRIAELEAALEEPSAVVAEAIADRDAMVEAAKAAIAERNEMAAERDAIRAKTREECITAVAQNATSIGEAIEAIRALQPASEVEQKG